MTELAPNGSGGYDNLGQTTYSYDSYGRSTGLTNSFNETTSVSYDSYSRPYRTDYPNGTYEVTTYDILNRPVTVILKNSSNTVLNSRSYTYDAVGQITSITEGGSTKSYGYDNIGQLVSADGFTYSYDANGNRTGKYQNNTAVEVYEYDAGDKITAAKNLAGTTLKSYSYDAAGRTTAINQGGSVTSFTYDYESRVKSITYPNSTSDAYSYNAFDTRTAQTGVSGTKAFRRAGLGVTAPVLGDGSARFTPGVSERRDGTSTFLNSGVKNTDVQTAANESITATRQYDAWGNLLASTGTWKGPSGYGGAFGYQEDANGLHLLGHRYYDSTTGRFLTRDPIRAGRNWYSYSENDPINSIDPSGLDRGLTAKERGFVIRAINQLRRDGYREQADLLQYRLFNDLITADDSIPEIAVTKGKHIYLGKSFFDLDGTDQAYASDAEKYDQTVANRIYAAAILLHEEIHATQFHYGPINEHGKEREAYQAAIVYLENKLNSGHLSKGVYYQLMFRLVEHSLSAGDYGWVRPKSWIPAPKSIGRPYPSRKKKIP